jgi:acyl-CoA thioesterase FadM
VKTYRHKVTVHWGHSDPAKIVFYPNYFVWFDQSALLLFESVGLDWDTLMSRDEIVVESHVAKWNEKTFELSHTVLNGPRRAVEGYEIRVWCRPDPDAPGGLKAFAIPPEVRAAFD